MKRALLFAFILSLPCSSWNALAKPAGRDSPSFEAAVGATAARLVCTPDRTAFRAMRVASACTQACWGQFNTCANGCQYLDTAAKQELCRQGCVSGREACIS